MVPVTYRWWTSTLLKFMTTVVPLKLRNCIVTVCVPAEDEVERVSPRPEAVGILVVVSGKLYGSRGANHGAVEHSPDLHQATHRSPGICGVLHDQKS
jgi:hypothetical protein